MSTTIQFVKYQGTGNDFILLDDRNETFPVSKELIAHLCHRRFGIGADGLILLKNAEGYDFRMVYFNADGAEGSMCGNGGRCTVRFAHDLGIFAENTRFIAVDGAHEAVADSEVIKLKMSPVKGLQKQESYDFLNTGSPHYVTFVDEVAKTEVVTLGRTIRYGDIFGPLGGTNVNFVEVVSDNHLKVRTYERGVEDETYSCGTGVTACALSSHAHFGWQGPVTIDTPGGSLCVTFQEIAPEVYDSIYLIGPAKRVFNGEVQVS
ncbi:diaminopimelate epimerase [Arundinibacter roseus]|uniref:Diaminopimelate epimerase n=1 Tax=Arundinibacter roseus TaxID=2070510 RepID=A0A4R4KJP1_9BACT|nr:diaminopimelate epimerase [Arundinibacter roseus]TDB68193.1 diaminopimelate epimerase [Arundinibacter roseus]